MLVQEASAMSSEPERRKASHTYVLMVQHLIERCLVLQLDQEQCVRALAKHARILPAVTTVVWRELEKGNKEFFAEYASRRRDQQRLKAYQQMRAAQLAVAGQVPECGSPWQCPEAVELLRQRQMEMQVLGLEGQGTHNPGMASAPDVHMGYPLHMLQGGSPPPTGMCRSEGEAQEGGMADWGSGRTQDQQVPVRAMGVPAFGMAFVPDELDVTGSSARSKSKLPT